MFKKIFLWFPRVFGQSPWPQMSFWDDYEVDVDFETIEQFVSLGYRVFRYNTLTVG